MSLFWFLSIPGKSSSRDSFNELSNIVGGADLKAGQSMSEVELPDLKFGNLDALMLLSDELVKLDQLYEQLVNKLIETLKSTLQNDPDTLHASLLVNNKEFDDYIKTFSWNSMKYRTDKSLREVTDMIIQEMTTLDSTLKTKSTQYTAIKNSLTSLNRKQNGNLSVRNLNDIVQKEHCIQDSEYLTTVFVAVPKNNYDDWEKSYERLSDMVVPRSAKKIAEDNDYGLFSVHLFKRVVESFSTTCRDNKFIVRDFQYSETQMEEERKELDRVATTEQDLWKSLVQWCQTSFSDAVSCLIHIKVIRVINESVLRYGLPSNYVASIVKVHQEPKLTKALLDNYGHLGGSKSGKGNEDKGNDEGDFGAAFAEDNDYVPYVRFAYTWNGELQSQQ